MPGQVGWVLNPAAGSKPRIPDFRLSVTQRLRDAKIIDEPTILDLP